MSASGMPGQASGSLGIKQWNQFIPPGWKPFAYPLKEFKNYLSLWAAMTSPQLAANSMSAPIHAPLLLGKLWTRGRPQRAILFHGAEPLNG